MTRTLKAPYQFATNGNYAAGALDWSGLPRIVVPSSATLADGYTPDTPIPAETLNYLGQLQADALAVQCHAALQNWQSLTIPRPGTDSYVSIVGMRRIRSYGTMTEAQRQVMLIGSDAAAGNKLRVCTSNDGTRLQASPSQYTIAGPFTAPTWGVPGAAGEMILVNDNTLFTYTTDGTVTWHAGTTPFSGPPAILGAHYVPAGTAAGYYLVNDATSGNGAIGKASTLALLGTTVTAANLPITTSSKVSAGKVEFADNGSVILVACVDNAGAAAVYRSIDGGATWARVLSIGAAANINIVWSDYWQLFIAWGDDGEIFSSSDGSAWGLTTSGRTPANGFFSGRGTLQAVGPAIVKMTNTASSAGIAYSFDLGATWFYWYFDGGDVGGNLSLRSINNRIYALGSSGTIFYRSGQLAVPSVAEI